MQREQMKTTASTPNSSVNCDSDEVENVATVSKKIRGPKMTAFDEEDSMDSYLNRFEKYAELQGWLTR